MIREVTLLTSMTSPFPLPVRLGLWIQTSTIRRLFFSALGTGGFSVDDGGVLRLPADLSDFGI